MSAAKKKPHAIAFVVADTRWRKKRGLVARLKRAAAAALGASPRARRGSLTVLLGGDAKLRALNRTFRGLDKPTNVLSFSAAPNHDDYRGDVAIAYGIARREAKAAAKDFSDHAAHLVVHGVLHLTGYDHRTARDAGRMEPLETKILAGLDISDPYAAPR